jgi:tRNA modification GTPase
MSTVRSEPRDTIFALASGAGRAGVAIIRVSGPRAELALEWNS